VDYVVVLQALVGSMGYVRIRFGVGAPTLSEQVVGELSA